MFLSSEKAIELGSTPWGDPDAPFVERVMSTFVRGDVAVRDERVVALGAQAGMVATEVSVVDPQLPQGEVVPV